MNTSSLNNAAPATAISPLARWFRFNLVGILGFAVQMVALAILHRLWRSHDLLASAAALELTLAHNFLWHLRYTWRDRRSLSPLRQFLRFQLSNGLVSLAGNLLLVRTLTGAFHLPLLAANALAVLLCALANFFLAHLWAFGTARAKSTHANHASEVVGLTILNLNQFAQHATKAEALIEEISHICKDVPKIDMSGTGSGAEGVERGGSQQNPRKKRPYTPSLT